jgi:transcriptional regulator with XRE-family HTH domain
MNLGEKISSARKNKGLSQEVLAENCGVSLRTIQRIETNQSKPRPYTLRVITEVLNISIEPFQQNGESEYIKTHSLAKINLINSSALLGVLIPLLNIIVPMILWSQNKENPLVDAKGRKVISFQILWLLFSLVTLLITHSLHYMVTGEFVSGRLPLVIMAYILLVMVNVFFIIKNTIRLKKGDIAIYPSVPNLL